VIITQVQMKQKCGYDIKSEFENSGLEYNSSEHQEWINMSMGISNWSSSQKPRYTTKYPILINLSFVESIRDLIEHHAHCLTLETDLLLESNDFFFVTN
jgi:hypothetical protein